eukprot:SAG22_NODE_2598_length_2402_cov_1.751194_2_plen_377_part_00
MTLLAAATLNFQGKGHCADSVATDGDSNDSCNGPGSWDERGVRFSNQAQYGTTDEYAWVRPVVSIVGAAAIDDVDYTTYRLTVYLKPGARNVYALFGDPGSPAILPPAFQQPAPFGTDIGGVHAAFFEYEPATQWDSYLTVGHVDMEHPDILDDVRMMSAGNTCELACDPGFEPRGAQPVCTAGVVTHSVRCHESSPADRPADGADRPATPTTTGQKPQRPSARPPPPLAQDASRHEIAAATVPVTAAAKVAASDDDQSGATGGEVTALSTALVVGGLVVAAVVVTALLIVVAKTTDRWEDSRVAAVLKVWGCRRTGVAPNLPPTITPDMSDAQIRTSTEGFRAAAVADGAGTGGGVGDFGFVDNQLFAGMTLGGK